MNDEGRGRLTDAKSAVVAVWLKTRDREEAAAKAAAESPPEAQEAAEESLLDRYMPTPQVAAVAVMALLAAGVVLGAVTDPFAQSAGRPTILVSAPTPAPEEAEEAKEPEVITEIVEEEAPSTQTVSEGPEEEPEEGPEEAPKEDGSETKKPPPYEPKETVLPPVTHLFVIMLGEQGYEATFGKASTAPYLSKTLAKKGELLENYYAVTQGKLANEVALLSGQGPTPQTAAGCPEYADITPGTVIPATVSSNEQIAGSGCVYPASTLTLPGQLKELGQTWKAYVEPPPGGLPVTCAPGPSPFAYFHSLLDSGECAESAVGLEQLAPDLAKKSTEVPAFSYIVPNACHDGSELACAPEQPAGPADADAFLETVVPEIEASEAFRVGGMIAITFAQAQQSGPTPDQSACCGTPEYPNMPPAEVTLPDAHGVKASGGGGRVGMLLISPYVLAGSVNEGYFNHFSFLRSVEELFGETTLLGYAAEPTVTPFDESVYNNGES
jgi:phosphatidylinositol-3-phosphatase